MRLKGSDKDDANVVGVVLGVVSVANMRTYRDVLSRIGSSKTRIIYHARTDEKRRITATKETCSDCFSLPIASLCRCGMILALLELGAAINCVRGNLCSTTE